MRLRAGTIRPIVQIALVLLLNFTVVGGLVVSQFLPVLRLTAAVNPIYPITNPEELHLCILGTTGRCLTGTWPLALLVPALAGLVVIGAVVGRALCGWACPFGLIQDLLAKARGRCWQPRTVRRGWHERLKRVKYMLLFLFTLLAITMALTSLAGTLPGGSFKDHWPELCQVSPYCAVCFPISIDTATRFARDSSPKLTRPYTLLQFAVLGTFLVGAVLVPRFWCRYFCWVGALGSLFNGVSLLSIRNDLSKCTNCGYCLRACPMGNDLVDEERQSGRTSGLNCVLCLKCVDSCPEKSLALHAGPKSLYAGGKDR